MDDVKIDAERDPFRKEGVKAREEDKTRQKKQALALKAVLDTRDGRAVIWQILSDTGIYRSSFDRDAAVMAFNEGQRNVGLRLLDRVMAVDIDAFKLMQDEAHERRKQRNAGS